MKRTVTILLGLLLSITSMAAAEEDVFAVILYAEGYEISIYLNDGTVEVLDVLIDDVIGTPLYEGESIETDDASYVEIQLYPSENVLKLSESTALTLDSMEGSGGGSELSLVYGSIRAKVEKLLVDNAFDILTGDAVAGVRGTDFGVDYLYDASEEAYVTDVFCFEGEVAVREKDESGAPEEYGIGPDEHLSLRPHNGGPMAFNRKPLPDDRRDFWNKRDFREAPIGEGRIDNRFPAIRDQLQRDENTRRLPPERRNQPGFQGAVPGRPPVPGQPGPGQPPLQEREALPNKPSKEEESESLPPLKRR